MTENHVEKSLNKCTLICILYIGSTIGITIYYDAAIEKERYFFYSIQNLCYECHYMLFLRNLMVFLR
jgi:hypothetical protein